MFAKRKKAPFIEQTQLSSLIAEDVEITGDVCFTHGIRIDGCIKGKVIGKAGTGPAHALLVLSDKGRVEGNIHCGDAVINGTVIGDVHIEHFLELKANAQVTGTIRYEHMQMEVGASVRGQLQRSETAAAAPTASADDKVIQLPVDMAARS